jgi:hypothetical protein
MGFGVRIARTARNYGGAVVLRKREAGEYMYGTWQRSRPERDARTCGTRISWSMEQKN